jgi:flagellar biogenesis protein FliO
MKSFIEDVKVYALNSGALMITFTKVEMILKILLLVISIVYTLMKIMNSIKNNKDETDK